MSRQVLTYPDVPDFLTQAEGDALYAPIGGGGGGDFLPLTGGTLTGSLRFSADNTHDIGASGATRPRDLFLGRYLYATDVKTPWLTATGNLGISAGLSNYIDFTTGGGSKWRLLSTGVLEPVGDNFYDIGEAGTNRPRDLFLARSLVAGGNVGVGVTPSAWHSNTRAFQVGLSGAIWGINSITGLYHSGNTYYDAGGARRAIATGSGIEMVFGQTQEPAPFMLKTAPSVAAGAAQTFTERLRMTEAGALTLTGTLGVDGSTSQIRFGNREGGAGYLWYASSNAAYLYKSDATGGTTGNKLSVSPTGTLTLNPDGGQAAIRAAGWVQVPVTTGTGEVYGIDASQQGPSATGVVVPNNTFVYLFASGPVGGTFSGLLIVNNVNNGEIGLFLSGGGTIFKIAGHANMIAGVAPGAAQTALYFGGGTYNIGLHHQIGTTNEFRVFALRTRQVQ